MFISALFTLFSKVNVQIKGSTAKLCANNRLKAFNHISHSNLLEMVVSPKKMGRGGKEESLVCSIPF